MKFLPPLCCFLIAIVLSEGKESKKQELLTRASAQLERLAPYRRTTAEKTTDDKWQVLENAAKGPGISERQAFEIYRLLPEDMQVEIANKVGGNRAMLELLANSEYLDSMQGIKRSGSKRETYESPPSEGYPAADYGGYPQGQYGEHYGEYPQESSGSDSSSIIQGSSSLIGGIAKGIIGGLVSASGSASQGSSSLSASSSQSSVQSSSSSSGTKKPTYGHYGPPPVYSVY